MPEEVTLAAVVNREAGGLAHVVEHRRPAQTLARPFRGEALDALHDAQRVLEHVIDVVGAALVEAIHRGKLGQGGKHYLTLLADGPACPAGGDDPPELRADALLRHSVKRGGGGLKGGLRPRLD